MFRLRHAFTLLLALLGTTAPTLADPGPQTHSAFVCITAKTTTYNYDSVGRLSSVANANSVTQAAYTYDAADRVATYTDSEGYVLTYAYDALDRITSIAYPDGTTDL